MTPFAPGVVVLGPDGPRTLGPTCPRCASPETCRVENARRAGYRCADCGLTFRGPADNTEARVSSAARSLFNRVRRALRRTMLGR